MKAESIKKLETRIYKTLKKDFPKAEQVAAACDVLSRRIQGGAYDAFLKPLLHAGVITAEEVRQTAMLLKREVLLQKADRELGADRTHTYPLGVLFHINPENAHGVAVYSMIEGLLCGNINLVKLPAGDMGITAFFLKELTELAPFLREYVYTFSVRSGDPAMKALAALADAIVVWGGDEAIRGVRALAGPNQKVIEWGHKISFAYVTKQGATDENLRALAGHVIETKQLLCSSCQGIYLEGMNEKEIGRFCRRLKGFLEEAAAENSAYDLAWEARAALNCHTCWLERRNIRVLRGKWVNLLYCRDRALEPSAGAGNLWVKSLERPDVIPTLKMAHGYLQTAGIACGAGEWECLRKLLIQAGVTNVRTAGGMSAFDGEDSHDGEYPLRRYTKVVRV